MILFFLFVMEKSEKFGKSRESQIRREFLKRIKRGYDEEPEKIRKLSEGILRMKLEQYYINRLWR